MQAHDALAALEAGRAASKLGRMARAVELFERALAAADADATLPRDSLLVAAVLQELIFTRMMNATLSLMPHGALMTDDAAFHNAARLASSRTDPRNLALSQRLMALLCACCDAGTLFAPLKPLERRASGTEEAHALRLQHHPGGLPFERADCLFDVAAHDVTWWPRLSDPAAEEARVRGVAGALRAVLTLYEHGVWQEGQRRRVRGLALTAASASLVQRLLRSAFGDGATSVGLLRAMRATCGLTRQEEAALLLRVLPGVTQIAGEDTSSAELETLERRAAEDVARHGLRQCALPGCGATEPQPKAFKVCGRCRRACYCSAAHQQQDWRRHKREDACAAAQP